MKQHPIDLLTEPILARSLARQRMGRLIVFSMVLGGILVVATTHSRWTTSRATSRLAQAEERAAHVLHLEERAAELRGLIGEAELFLDRYDQVAMPLEMSAILATVCNQFPPSVALDRIRLDASRQQLRRSPRSQGQELEIGPPDRVLTAELAGFAANDEEIAQLVDALATLPPLTDVSLDFSRTRIVRDRAAREFRLSFRVDLEVDYEMVSTDTGATQHTSADTGQSNGEF